MEKETITGLYKEPGKEPVTLTVPNEVKAFQDLVKGYFETLTISTDCVFVLNEQGKLLNMTPNFFFCGDVFVGPVFICGTSGEDFADLNLSDEDMKFLLASIRNNDCFGIPRQM